MFYQPFLPDSNSSPAPRSERCTARTSSLAPSELPRVDRTVELLRQLSRGGKTEMAMLRDAVRSEQSYRDLVVAACVQEPSLFSDAARRGALLRSLRPFSNEPGVTELALKTLENPSLKNSGSPVSTAAKILCRSLSRSATSNPGVERRLIDVAARYAPGGGDMAAAAALRLLPATLAATSQAHLICEHARSWFVRRNSAKNPWLKVIEDAPTRGGVELLRKITLGRVPSAGRETLWELAKRLQLAAHDLALTSTVATVATRQLCAYLSLPKAISNASIAILSSGLVLGSRAIASFRKAEKLNTDRDFERVEALARLGAIRRSLASQDDAASRRLVGRCAGVLHETSRAGWQGPIVRLAAAYALEGEIADPVALWNAAAKQSDQPYAERPIRPDVEL